MLSAMIKKELLLVFRDKHALMALFVMPAIFILIMSIAMRDQFNSKNIEFKLYIKNLDDSNLSKNILSSIKNDKTFTIVSSKESAQFVLNIPKDYAITPSETILLNIKDSIKSDQIDIFKSMLSKHILEAKIDKIKSSSQMASFALSSVELSVDKLYKVKYNNSEILPNSTQQSVPAWIVFGMFFIIIPMSTIYVNERKQNTLTRLNSMNVSIFAMTFSKSVPYFLINQIQVWIMIAVGMFIVPLFDTPALAINGSILAIFIISSALSISAIGVSTLIAVSANSSEQATTIGGILNILLGAIGGVMVPKFIMPEAMQNIAQLSPMSWGLDGFLDIFLTDATVVSILDNATKLMLFGLLSLIVSMIVLHLRIKKGL